MKLLAMFSLLVAMLGWIVCIEYIESNYAKYFLMFVVAPVGEELYYRWLPLQIGKRINFIDGCGLIANFFFINLHIHNYSYGGWYWAFAIQGVMGWVSFVICHRLGYGYSVLFHSCYNIAIYAFF